MGGMGVTRYDAGLQGQTAGVKTAHHESSCSRKYDNGITEEEEGKHSSLLVKKGGSKLKKKESKHAKGR